MRSVRRAPRASSRPRGSSSPRASPRPRARRAPAGGQKEGRPMPSLDRLASKLRQTLERLVDVSVPSFEEVRELLGHVDGILAHAQLELAGYLAYEDPDDPDKEHAPCPFAELETADSHLDEVREILKAH